MSEAIEVTEQVADVQQPAFANPDFEAALAAAFGEGKTEPSNPEPDIVEPVVKPAKKVAKVAETLDDVVEDEEPDIVLPIDEEDEVVEAEEEPDVSGMTKIAATRFKELRTEAKEFKKTLATKEQELAQAAARVKELEALSGTSEEVQKKLDAYELELSVSRLEATDSYQKAVTQPLADIATTAEALATKHELDVNKLLDAIAISDPTAQDEAFEELLAGVNDRDKLKIYSLAEKLPAIMTERERLQAYSSTALAELDARKEAEKAAEAVENSKLRKAAVELVTTRVLAKLPFLKEEGFSTDAVKAKIADTDFDALDVTSRAYNAFAGHLVPQLAKNYVALQKELEQVTDELGKYKKASPALKGSSSVPAAGTDATLSFAESIERALSGVS